MRGKRLGQRWLQRARVSTKLGLCFLHSMANLSLSLLAEARGAGCRYLPPLNHAELSPHVNGNVFSVVEYSRQCNNLSRSLMRFNKLDLNFQVDEKKKKKWWNALSKTCVSLFSAKL